MFNFMKIHILTFSKRHQMSDVTKTNFELLSTAAEKLGHETEIIYAPECQLIFNKKPSLLVNGQEIKKKDIKVVLVRANFLRHQTEFKGGVIKQFELLNLPVINKYTAIKNAKNKMRTFQILNKHKVPIPKTFILSNIKYIDEISAGLGKFPIIIKNIFGAHGNGVSIIESKRTFRSVISMLISTNHEPIMVQEYIRESQGKDMRVFIVGKRIIGAMERIATKKGEFRSNFHLGGKVRVTEMTDLEKKVAFKAVKVLKLDIAGVDILRTKTGPKVIEVNSNPGLEGITKATKRDIAGEIIKYAIKFRKKFLKNN